MKHLLFTFVFLAGTALSAATIDFDAEAAAAGNQLTGVPWSPLTVGIATFTGGELVNSETGLLADTSGVYATEGVFGTGETNPLMIRFAVPVNNFSIFVANGDAAAMYTITDNAGDSVVASLPETGAGGSHTFSLPGSGITSVEIMSGNADGWNFAIDDVAFTATPEPGSAWICLTGLAIVGAGRFLLWKRRRA